jgi:branched-chain amino acid transport system ATP-binding protein
MLLDVAHLNAVYGHIRALHGIDFAIDAGEIVTIIGANGAGKSSTLRAVSRMIPAGPGTRMRFDGHDLLTFPPEKVVSRLGISHVPEGRRLFGNLTVLENLQLATFARKDREGVKNDIRQVFRIFTRLDERRHQKAGTLSGGEQQMLAVGRAFMSGRRLMLLDEPSMGLSPLLMKRVFHALKGINQTEGTAILLVEQNARLALTFASRGYVLETGHMVLDGPAQDLLHNDDVKKAYLGG